VDIYIQEIFVTCGYIYICVCVSTFLCLDSRSKPRPPQWWGFEITLRHTTLGTTPVDEWSTRRRDLYLTKRRSLETDILDPGGIRTRSPGEQEAADPRLRPRGHREVTRLFSEVVDCKMK